jgi:hypothetical protein
MKFSIETSGRDTEEQLVKEVPVWDPVALLGREESRSSSPATSDEGDEIDDGASVDSASVYSVATLSHLPPAFGLPTTRHASPWDVSPTRQSSASAFSMGQESPHLAYDDLNSPEAVDDTESIYGGFEEVQRVEEVLKENEVLRQRVRELERERDAALDMVRRFRLAGP